MSNGLAFPLGTEGICNAFYGTFTKADARDCVQALSRFRRGSEPIEYSVNTGHGDYQIPFNHESGACMIQVEMNGQHMPRTFKIAPDEIRSLADIVFEQCVKGEHGVEGKVGGFVTSETTTMKEWITSRGFDFGKPYPPWTSYLSVSFSHPVPDWLSAGRNDPIMAFVFSDAALKGLDETKPRSPFSKELIQRSERLFRQGELMEPRGQRIPWYDVRPLPSELVGLRNSTVGFNLLGPSNSTTVAAATAKRRRRSPPEKAELVQVDE